MKIPASLNTPLDRQPQETQDEFDTRVEETFALLNAQEDPDPGLFVPDASGNIPEVEQTESPSSFEEGEPDIEDPDPGLFNVPPPITPTATEPPLFPEGFDGV